MVFKKGWLENQETNGDTGVATPEKYKKKKGSIEDQAEEIEEKPTEEQVSNILVLSRNTMISLFQKSSLILVILQQFQLFFDNINGKIKLIPFQLQCNGGMSFLKESFVQLHGAISCI